MSKPSLEVSEHARASLATRKPDHWSITVMFSRAAVVQSGAVRNAPVWPNVFANCRKVQYAAPQYGLMFSRIAVRSLGAVRSAPVWLHVFANCRGKFSATTCIPRQILDTSLLLDLDLFY